MKITVIGSGYVGLVTAACFSSLGHKVLCLDTNQKKIKDLQHGKVPIYEPGLEALIKTSLKNNSIIFSSSYKEASSNNIIFLCLGTPDKNEKSDMSFFYSARDSLCDVINKDTYIFTKSTVPIGTNYDLENFMNESLTKKLIKVRVASNPEFLKEGSAVSDFLKPDRIIIGTSSKKMKSLARKIFAPIHRQKPRIIFMKRESAELSKYASNAFLASKISFMNEMSWISEAAGADINEVRLGMGSDTRIGSAFLYSGIGYGGSCFPKDLNGLIHFQKENNRKSFILEATKKVNEMQLDYFYKKIINYFSTKSKKTDITIWGLSFKPGTDDIRESIALKLIKKVAPHFQSINLYDPMAIKNARSELSSVKNLNYFTEKNSSISKSTQGLIICTEWKEFWTFEEVDYKNIKVVFDGRNIYSPSKFDNLGIDYFGVGNN
jgi:UDPglucose 6-dehydrogenase